MNGVRDERMILSKQCQDARGREHRRAVVAHDEARYDPEAAVRRHGDARRAARAAEWCLVRSRSTAGGVSREQFQCGIQGLRAVGIRLGNIMEETMHIHFTYLFTKHK